MIGINVGSGQRRFHNCNTIQWVNVDLVSRAGMEPDIQAPADSIPLEDEIADYVVLHQMLEHAHLQEGISILAECRRLLKSGGSLLVFVPDLKALAIKWITQKIDDYIFFVNCCGAYMGNEADFHRWHYSFESLRESLESVGRWREYKRFDWREVPGASLANDFWVLGVEAIK